MTGRRDARGPADEARMDEVVALMRRGRKYATLADETLRRMAGWAARRHPSPRDAARAARRKLHQVYGAYLSPGDLGAAERLLAGVPADAPREAVAAAAREILGRHASSAERLGFMEALYRAIWEAAGGPQSIGRVLDLACGLHPLALPWMGLEREVEYIACDLDLRLVSLVEAFRRRWGQAGRARAHDLLCGPLPRGAQRADVVLLLKTLPCLERQEAGAALRLLRSLSARLVVISFPAQSLGGREKGMRAHYETFAATLIEELGARAQRLDYPTETLHLLQPVVGARRSAQHGPAPAEGGSFSAGPADCRACRPRRRSC